MFEKLKNFLVNSLGFFGYGIFYMLLCAIVYAPIFVLDLPWYASFIVALLFSFIPSIGYIALPILTIVAFPRALSLGVCFSSVLFYVSAAIYMVPALLGLASLLLQWCKNTFSRITGKVFVEQPESWYTCPQCGSLVRNGDTCDCGFAPVGKKLGSPMATAVVCVLLLISVGVNVWQAVDRANVLASADNEIRVLNNYLKQKNEAISRYREKSEELENIISRKNDLVDSMDEHLDAAIFMYNNIGFIVDGSSYYHEYNCPVFQSAGEYWAHNIEYCKYLGYSACPSCW